MLTIDFAKLNIQPGDRLLDLGCGEGRHCISAYLLYPEINVVGVDLSQKDLTIARQRFDDCCAQFEPESSKSSNKSFSLQRANGLTLPFADSSFDKVICSEVLEHIPDYQAVLREITRVLKPDGLLAISVPRNWPEKICWWLSEAYHRVEGGHIRIFNAGALQNDVASLGWRRYARHWAHALHVPFWWLKCLFWEKQDENFLIKTYHRLLVWDLMQKPLLTQTLDKLLNPIMGKSVVMYFKREDSL